MTGKTALLGGLYRHLYVGGRGYGKAAMMRELAERQKNLYLCPADLDPNVPENWQKVEGAVPQGMEPTVSIVDEVPSFYEGTNYSAQMSFTREASGSWEEWIDKLSGRFRSEVLGQWFEYTPAEELRDRLNDSLQGKEPRPAINTRYWRNL